MKRTANKSIELVENLPMNYFHQFELEDAIYKCLPFGAEITIAKRLGKSPGIISQYFNPSDDRESPIYKAAAMLAVLMDIDPEAGRSALEILTYYVERGLPKDQELSVDKTREQAFRESAEFQLAEASGKTTGEIKRELRESIAAQQRHLEAIEAGEQAVRERRLGILEAANGRRNGTQ